jgi:hypothetical protein
MHLVSDWSIYGLRTLLLVGAFVGFAWAMLSARRQAAEAHAQMAAKLETALAEIRRLSGQMIVLGGSVELLGTRLVQAQAQAEAQAQARPRRQPRKSRRRLPHRTRAATKPPFEWRAAAPRSKRSSRTAAPPARKPNY